MRLVLRVLGILVVGSAAFAQNTALTAPRNLAQLSQQAATIVRGNVTSVRIEPHPQLANLTTVVVSLRVTQSLKGNSGSVLTFRQFIWDIRDKYEAAGYRKGQDLLLLLNPVSTYGLTSPAGMDQGRFEILLGPRGIPTAVNGYGNVGLFSNMSAQIPQTRSRLSQASSALLVQHRNGPVPLTQLEELIQAFGGAGQ
jgi:hypothetical protein